MVLKLESVPELPGRLVKTQIASFSVNTPSVSDPVGPERGLHRGISNKFPNEMLKWLVWAPRFKKHCPRRQHATGKESGYISDLGGQAEKPCQSGATTCDY